MTTDKRDLESLLLHLKEARGFDFTAYKRSTLGRRVEKRMQALQVGNHGDYIDYLEVHPDEFEHLFNTILINVTGFFRDPTTWDRLREEIISQLAAVKANGQPIRVWSAGCASGEEPYGLAILLADALGVDRFKEQVKIYATDVDEDALVQGRHGSYTERQVGGLPPELLSRYFERANGRFVFSRELRRGVIFGRHDLLKDAPISRVSLLVCRNTLMYFNAEAQVRIVDRFHYALEQGGYLFLGKAEMLVARSTAFVATDLKARLFQKIGRSGPSRDRFSAERNGQQEQNGSQPMAQQSRLEMLALEADPVAQLVVDRDLTVIVINMRARSIFGLGLGDIGRSLQDLEISYRPVELRSLIDQACAERRQTFVKEIEWTTSTGDVLFIDVTVLPLFDPSDEMRGAKVLFRDVTRIRRLQDELKGSNQELETAYEELQSTNEELETTNEELQSTVEELETTNEELQSTNEELETMNEELQSTNEELSTANDELKLRSDDVNHLNAFLHSIMTGLSQAVIVVDASNRVQSWNRKAEELWGLRSDEASGQHLLDLDVGFPMDRLRQPIKSVMSGQQATQTIRVDGTNRRGRPMEIDVRCDPLGSNRDIRGVILMIDAREKPADARKEREHESRQES